MAGLRNYVIGLLLVLLFAFFVLEFAGNFILATNPSSDIMTNPKYNMSGSLSKLNESISLFSSISEDARTQLKDADVSPVDYLFLIFKGAFQIPKLFLTFVMSGVSALSAVLFPQIGGTGGLIFSIILGAISSALVVTIVLLVIKSIRTGESER